MIVGVTGVGVMVGQGVGDFVGVGDLKLVAVGLGVFDGRGVTVGNGVRVRVSVADGHGVRVGVFEGVRVSVRVGVRLGSAVGGVPWTMNVPDLFHVSPENNWTWYSPSSHSCGSGSQSVKPRPPEPPFQGIVS